MTVFDKIDWDEKKIEDELIKHPQVKKDWFWMKLAEKVEAYKPKDLNQAILYYKKAI